MLDLIRDRSHDQARRKAADIEVNVLIKRYGDAEVALVRCDQLIKRHDDPSKLRFLRLVRERLVAIAAA